jgi:hypothetical protein
MNRIENVVLIFNEDAVGKPYLVIATTAKDGYPGPVEMKLWAENIVVIDNRRK